MSLVINNSGIGTVAIGGTTIFGGTSGSVLFVDSGGYFGQDNANFFWDDTNNRLGLLTNSPTNTLDLGTGGTFRVRDMTAGSVFFAGTNGVLTQDNSNLFWDDTNNRLGVGTNSPSTPIHILSASTNPELLRVVAPGGGKITLLRNDSTTPAGQFRFVGSDNAEKWSFGTNILVNGITFEINYQSTNLVAVQSTGNVGIGVTSPSYQFQVNSGTTAFGVGSDGQLHIGNGGVIYSPSNFQVTASPGGNMQLISTAGGEFNVFTGGSQRLTVQNGGNVGIGTTNPSNKLTISNATGNVTGEIQSVAAGANAILKLNANASNYWELINDGTNANLAFARGGSEFMRISNVGNVGIGTTGPDTLLHVVGRVKFVGDYQQAWATETNTIGGGGIQFIDGWNTIRQNTSHALNFDVYNSGSQLAAITILQTGIVGIGSSSPSGSKLEVRTTTTEASISGFQTSTSGNCFGVSASATGVGSSINIGGQYTAANGGNNIALYTNTDTAAGTGNWAIRSDSTAQNYFAGNLGIGTSTVNRPAAKLELDAGTATASTAPLKFNSGTSLTSPVAGVIEFTTDDLFFTITTGAARKAFILDNGSRLTSGKMPKATTNGRLVDTVASSAYTPSNVTTDRSYDANLTSLDEIADVLGTLIADLQSHGLLG